MTSAAREISRRACALAPDTGLLIAARAIQGAGAALVMPLAVALLTNAFPPEKRGGALGLFTALTGLAVVGGPLLGGAVTEGIAWQWIFWINVPIGAILIPLVLVRTTESRGPTARPDLPGLVLVSAGMFGIVWGLVRANTVGWGWTSSRAVPPCAPGSTGSRPGCPGSPAGRRSWSSSLPARCDRPPAAIARTPRPRNSCERLPGARVLRARTGRNVCGAQHPGSRDHGRQDHPHLRVPRHQPVPGLRPAALARSESVLTDMEVVWPATGQRRPRPGRHPRQQRGPHAHRPGRRRKDCRMTAYRANTARRSRLAEGGR